MQVILSWWGLSIFLVGLGVGLIVAARRKIH
jgi:hypothetical protein